MQLFVWNLCGSVFLTLNDRSLQYKKIKIKLWEWWEVYLKRLIILYLYTGWDTKRSVILLVQKIGRVCKTSSYLPFRNRWKVNILLNVFCITHCPAGDKAFLEKKEILKNQWNTLLQFKLCNLYNMKLLAGKLFACHRTYCIFIDCLMCVIYFFCDFRLYKDI